MKEMRESIGRSIANYCNALEVRMGELEKERNELNRLLSDMASKDEGLVPLLREQKVMEELYLMLLKKREENALALATTEPSARILEPAFGSNAPVAPQTVPDDDGRHGRRRLCKPFGPAGRERPEYEGAG